MHKKAIKWNFFNLHLHPSSSLSSGLHQKKRATQPFQFEVLKFTASFWRFRFVVYGKELTPIWGKKLGLLPKDLCSCSGWLNPDPDQFQSKDSSWTNRNGAVYPSEVLWKANGLRFQPGYIFTIPETAQHCTANVFILCFLHKILMLKNQLLSTCVLHEQVLALYVPKQLDVHTLPTWLPKVFYSSTHPSPPHPHQILNSRTNWPCHFARMEMRTLGKVSFPMTRQNKRGSSIGICLVNQCVRLVPLETSPKPRHQTNLVFPTEQPDGFPTS